MKTISSRINAAKPARLQLTGMILLAFVLCVLGTGMGGCANKSYADPPLTLVEDSVPKTIQVAAKDGWVPCPGECLKLATPGWQHKEVQGFSPSDIWMAYRYTDSQGESWQAYSQRHIGHIIRPHPDKAAEDVGICPICNGTGWVRKDDQHVKKIMPVTALLRFLLFGLCPVLALPALNNQRGKKSSTKHLPCRKKIQPAP